MFKDVFKYYKKKIPPPNLQNVLRVGVGDSEFFAQFELQGKNQSKLDDCEEFGLLHPTHWKAFELKNHPGLIFILNPFTNNGQRYWIARSIADYTTEPNITNVSQQRGLSSALENRSWWDIASCEVTNNKDSFSRKMRWATVGYHHNWDTKVYSEDVKSEFPDDLKRLSEFIIEVTLNIGFKPEAAIVNFYLMDSFLSGHVDRSELNTSAPLISLSFGQTAIFLIGGETINIEPDAIYLESGDVILMTEQSRLQYHGVPKIIPSNNAYWDNFSDCDKNTSDLTKQDLIEESKQVTMRKVADHTFWTPFSAYISKARINVNVRQVNFHDAENENSQARRPTNF